jgi:hypothetical protein
VCLAAIAILIFKRFIQRARTTNVQLQPTNAFQTPPFTPSPMPSSNQPLWTTPQGGNTPMGQQAGANGGVRNPI